jgi:hypothetical protein
MFNVGQIAGNDERVDGLAHTRSDEGIGCRNHIFG